MEEEEREQYLLYVKACREGNQAVRQDMYRNGFRPDRQRLMYFASKSAELYDLIFNERFILNIDSGHVVGHVYIDYPVYDASTPGAEKMRKQMGFYPKENGLRALHGQGTIKDEVQESGRVLENHPTAKAVLPIPQEVAIQIEHWRRQQPSTQLIYSLLNKNCIAFVDEVLQQSGYVDGLTDKFNGDDISKLNFKAIKVGIKFYFRTDNEVILKLQEKVDEKIGLSGIKIRNDRMHYQYYGKDKADRFSFENQCNIFFNSYHSPEFYSMFFQGKRITESDYLWALNNHLSGSQVMMFRYSPLRDRFLQFCRPKELRYSVRYRFSSENPFFEVREEGERAILALEHQLVSNVSIDSSKHKEGKGNGNGYSSKKPYKKQDKKPSAQHGNKVVFSFEQQCVAFKERENQKRQSVIDSLQARIAALEKENDHNRQKYSLEMGMAGCVKPTFASKQSDPRDPKLTKIQSMNFRLTFNSANDFLRSASPLPAGQAVKIHELRPQPEVRQPQEIKQRNELNVGIKRQTIMRELKQQAEKIRISVNEKTMKGKEPEVLSFSRFAANFVHYRPHAFGHKDAFSGFGNASKRQDFTVFHAAFGSGNCKKMVARPAMPNKKQ